MAVQQPLHTSHNTTTISATALARKVLHCSGSCSGVRPFVFTLLNQMTLTFLRERVSTIAQTEIAQIAVVDNDKVDFTVSWAAAEA